MKLIFNGLKDTSLNLLRRLGYAFLRRDERTGELSFTRRMSNGDYPRFHVFASQNAKGDIVLNLHLDQKKPSYQGSSAHSGEYQDEGVLKQEAERIELEFKK
jgi:hypothetical protein